MFSMFARGEGRVRTAHRRFAPSLEQVENRVVLSVTIVGRPTLQVEKGQNMACQTFINTGTKPVQVSIAAYAIQDVGQGNSQWPWVPEIFRSQVYTDSTTVTLAPGQTREVCVGLPCGASRANAFQIDAFVGGRDEVIKNFVGFPNYDSKDVPDFTFAFLFDVTCADTTKTKGNEGLGNGVDPPPPGHSTDPTQNDDSGSPGKPNKGNIKP